MGCASSKNVVSVTPALDSSGILRDHRRSEAVLEKSSRDKSDEEKEKIEEEKETVKPVSVESPKSVSVRLGNLQKHTEGEQVAAGWPRWLAAVAGEAIYGWLPLQAENFEKLDKVIMEELGTRVDS